jgi:hypothetical protein
MPGREPVLRMMPMPSDVNATGDVFGRTMDVSALNSGRALRERRPLVIEDADVQGGVHPSFRDVMPSTSIVSFEY